MPFFIYRERERRLREIVQEIIGVIGKKFYQSVHISEHPIENYHEVDEIDGQFLTVSTTREITAKIPCCPSSFTRKMNQNCDGKQYQSKRIN